MIQQTKPIIIVCEGQSEVAYIQELNRLLTETHIRVVLIPKNVGGGHYSQVGKRYKGEKARNPRSQILIWVDYDIHARNDNETRTAYENKTQGIPDFYFNHQNFEDFLALHLSKEVIEDWQTRCLQHGHFTQPLHADQYKDLYRSHVSKDYLKGEMPFELSIEHIKQLCDNNADSQVSFSSDFASWLQGQLQGYL